MKKLILFVAAVLVAAISNTAFANGAPPADPAIAPIQAPAVKAEPEKPCPDSVEKTPCVKGPLCQRDDGTIALEKKRCEQGLDLVLGGQGKHIPGIWQAQSCDCVFGDSEAAFCNLRKTTNDGRPDPAREAHKAYACKGAAYDARLAREKAEREKAAKELREELEGQIAAVQQAVNKAASADDLGKANAEIAALKAKIAELEAVSEEVSLVINGDGTSENPGLRKRVADLTEASLRKFVEIDRRLRGHDDAISELRDGHSDQERRIQANTAAISDLKPRVFGLIAGGIFAQPKVQVGGGSAPVQRDGNGTGLGLGVGVLQGPWIFIGILSRVTEEGHTADQKATEFWGSLVALRGGYRWEPISGLRFGPDIGLNYHQTSATLSFAQPAVQSLSAGVGGGLEWFVLSWLSLNVRTLPLTVEWWTTRVSGANHSNYGWNPEVSASISVYSP